PVARSSASSRPASRPPSSSTSDAQRWPRSCASRMPPRRPGRRRRGPKGPSRAETRLAAIFDRIDHVGVAVADLGDAISLYQETLEMPLVHRETVDEQGVEAALLDVGDGHVELLRPLGPETPVGRFIARSGPGLHHVAYRVGDIDAALERLAADGVELI